MSELELYEDEEERERSLTPAEIQQENDEAIRAQVERVSTLSAELAALATMTDDDASQSLVTRDATPAGKKRELGALRVRAARQQAAIEAKREEVKQASREMENLMHKQMEIAERALAPLEKFVKRLEEGIWMVNLYLGRDEEILSLRDGDHAPADVPVAIRQLVLYMDEECAINPEGDGIDALSIELFDEWLQEDPRHVDQVLPEQKGVVALQPRREKKRYRDPWLQQSMNDANEKTYFLIRNGDKLWRTWTDFNVGEHLVAQADEFSSFFYEKERSTSGRRSEHRVPIQPGTLAWERAEEAADARQRHFMRVGLILQGLVDRTTVFHPLPDGGINFMDYEHGDKTWRFVIDAENLIDTGRLPFREWQRSKNAELRVGMRIIGAFHRWGDREMYGSRISPRNAETPPTGELLYLESRGGSDGSFAVRYKRHEKIWKGYHSVEATRRASCIIETSDENILPFDLITEEEMLVYLNARMDRHAYANMFPILKAAIRAKRREREEEKPFRTMLIGVLARDNRITVETADAIVDDLIEWFKLKNKYHRPLVGEGEAQAKAVRLIVAEERRRRTTGAPKAAVVEKIRGQMSSKRLLAVARRRAGTYVAITRAEHRLFADVDYQSPYVHLHEFSARGEPRDEPKPWVLLSPRTMSSLAVGWADERFESWDIHAEAREHLSGPELERLSSMVVAEGKKLIAVAYDPKKRRFYTWEYQKDAVVSEAPFTGKFSKPVVEERSRGWTRKGVEAPTLTEHSWSSNRPRYSYQRKPWDTRPEPGKTAGYWNDVVIEDEAAFAAKSKYILLFHDEAREEHYLEQKTVYVAADKRRRTKSDLAHAFITSIEKAWVARREAEEYERFLEDYLDPALWEGHKKSLPRGVFDYPHAHSRSWRRDPDALSLMVEYHVEAGLDLDGISVWDATHNYPPIGWLKNRLSSDWGRVSKKDLPEAIDIPADIRYLVFTAPVVDEAELDEEGELHFTDEDEDV